ncbi:MAG TPA: pilus assembly protein PilM [Leucothrix mucor]|uniref:Pilus assembly protein PilM n=1 Tax=Leucothrix mucor TaxID=45248 RepID=A0A7V2SYY7_LEUMU|nr:pilus assembly protein PilM [Leucothrix mucor]
MFSIGGKKGNLLGIDISSSAVKLIELSRKGNNYRVDSYSVASLPEGAAFERDIIEADPVGEAIRKVIKNSRTKSRHCALGIPSSMAINKIIAMPDSIPASEMEAQIEMEAEQYIPYPMDEVNFDFEIVGPSATSGMVDVLLGATRTENVEVRLAAAEMAGLTVDVVDLESNAIELLFSNLVNDISDHETVAVVDFGASMTGINVFEKGHVAFSREQVFGGKQLTEEIMQRYGLPYSEAGLAKKNGNLPEGYIPEVLDPFRENMVRQVQRFLQFYHASTQQGKVEKLLLSGGCASIPGIDEQIQEATGIPVSLANPFSNMVLNGRVNPARFTSDIPAMLVSTGLALRGLE